jgi:hypothetical protein
MVRDVLQCCIHETIMADCARQGQFKLQGLFEPGLRQTNLSS